MTPEFTQRIGATPIALSVFEDQRGSWAKRWCDVALVRVVFNDNVTEFLTPGEFRALPQSHRDAIYRAPSSINLLAADPDTSLASWP